MTGLSPVSRTVGPFPPVSSVNVKFAEPVSSFDEDPKPMKVSVRLLPAPEAMLMLAVPDEDSVRVKSEELSMISRAGLMSGVPSVSVIFSGGFTGPLMVPLSQALGPSLGLQ